MPRWFNTAGPCQADIHYMLPPVQRLPNVERLIEQRNYFVIHAPRQTGKTTAVMALAQQLTESGRYTSVMVSVEVGSPFSHQPAMAEAAILDAWLDTARVFLPASLRPSISWKEAEPGRRIGFALRQWAETSPRPLVLFIDEIDSLQDTTLLSVLRQLRDGYPARPHAFPHALGLIGLRDVRDCKVTAKVTAGGGERLNTASPFNVKVKSLTLQNFSLQEVAALYAQHTQDTGQRFEPEAIALAFNLSQGQPWLVNALAREIVEDLVPKPTQPISVQHFQQAKEILIQRRDTHLDSLAERLQEPRVRAIIEPMLAGQELDHTADDDRQFLVDLGLVRRDPQGGIAIANPIYQEVIPRVLTGGTQDSLPRIAPTWLTATGELDTACLLEAFLAFWRQHGEPLLRSASYHEIAPHIVLMAFLHRVVNGGGTLEREYAIGSDRMDICLRYGQTVLGIELKVWRERRPDPVQVGLAQLDGYLSRLGLDTGWLVIFDQRVNQPPIAERTAIAREATPSGRQITVIRA